MKLDIRPIAGSCGAEVAGLDLSRSPDDGTASALRAALSDHRVLFFRAQQLDPDAHIGFARALGTPDSNHPPYIPTLDGHPEIAVLSGQQGGRADVWHTDFTISPTPPAGSILNMRVCPEYGGDTMWCDLSAAWEALSGRMQAYLDGLYAVHDLAGTIQMLMRERSIQGESPVEGESGLHFGKLPRSRHPVVRSLPGGRRALFVNPTFTSHIEELPRTESDAILQLLYDHMVQPEFTCRWRWQQGDLGVWDNTCTMHYAIADYGESPREIHRVTLVGSEPV